MRYLVISDIHGNLEALETVLRVLDGRYDRTLVLGDLVGYGADPNAVVDRVRALEPHVRRSAATTTRSPPASTTARASTPWRASAVLWTYEALTPDNREYLASLPAGPQVVDDLIEICHGTPFDEDAYLFDDLDALRAFEAASRPVCLFGHTHVAVAFRYADSARDRRRARRHRRARASTFAPEREVPDQRRIGRPAARRRPARRRRDRRRRRADDRAVPDSVSDRGSAAEDPAGGAARSPGETAVARAVGRGRRSARAVGLEGCATDPQTHDLRPAVLRPPTLLFPAPQFGRIGVACGAAAEDPSDHDADEQHRGDEDEVPGGHAPHRGGVRFSASRSFCTAASRRQSIAT